MPVFLGVPCGSTGKESAFNEGDLGLIPGLERPPGEGKGYPLQYSGLYSPWGHKESDMTERLSLVQFTIFLIMKSYRFFLVIPLSTSKQVHF